MRLYFHARDKDGVIRFPEQPTPEREETEAECLLALLQLRPVMRPEDYERAVRDVVNKFRGIVGEGEGEGEQA